jgi:hypothetical protein
MAATRSKHQRAMDLEVINTWTIQGKTLRQCAADLAKIRDYEVSHVTIKHDLDTIKARWNASMMGDRKIHVAKELARIDKLEETYWAGWLNSLEPVNINTRQTRSGEATKITDVTIPPGMDAKEAKPKDVRHKSRSVAPGEQISETSRTEERDGNPAFLAGVERCIKMRMDLLGLNAPTKSEDTVTIQWEIVREDDNQRPADSPAHPAPGAEDYLQ